MFDTRTEKFQERVSPTPEYFPYDVSADENGEAWAVAEFCGTVSLGDANTKGNHRVKSPYLAGRTHKWMPASDASTTDTTMIVPVFVDTV